MPTGTTNCGSSRPARVARCPVEVAAGDTTVTITDTADAVAVAVAAGTDTTTTAGIKPTECTRPTARSTRPGWPRAAPWLVSTGGHSTRHRRGRNITTTRTQTRHSGTHRAIGPSRGCPNVESLWAIFDDIQRRTTSKDLTGVDKDKELTKSVLYIKVQFYGRSTDCISCRSCRSCRSLCRATTDPPPSLRVAVLVHVADDDGDVVELSAQIPVSHLLRAVRKRAQVLGIERPALGVL